MEEIEAEKENSHVYVRVTWNASPSRDLRTRVGCGQNRLYYKKRTLVCFSHIAASEHCDPILCYFHAREFL